MKLNTYVVEGGVGKCTAFTALISKLKQKADIQIYTPYVGCFAGNPNVKMAFENTLPLLDPRIKASNNIFYCEPYKSNFQFGKQHLIESYCEHHGVEYHNSMIPKIYTKNHSESVKEWLTKNEIDKYNKALNVSDLKKLAVSGIYGASEVATEMLTTVRLVKDLKSANTLFYKEGFAPAFKQAIKDIPLGGALEGGGEGLNNIIGNVADITILKEDKNAFDGVTESAAQGFFIGNGFKVANVGSLAKAYAYDIITDKQNKQEIKSILKEINNLSSAFTENTDINTKAEAARVIRSKIKELSLNQDFSASQFLKLSEADQKAVFEADRQSKKVNERWKKIANSNLDDTSKDLIRKDLESEFNSYQDKKISLLRKSNVNTELQQPKGLQEGDFYRGYKICLLYTSPSPRD